MTGRTGRKDRSARHANGSQPTDTVEDIMPTITVPPITVYTDEPLHIVHNEQLGHAAEADKAARAAGPLEIEADQKFNLAAQRRQDAARLVAEADLAEAEARAARNGAAELRDAATRHSRIAETLKEYTAVLAKASNLPDPNDREPALPPGPPESDTPIHAAVAEQAGTPRLVSDLLGQRVAPTGGPEGRVTQAMPAVPPATGPAR